MYQDSIPEISLATSPSLNVFIKCGYYICPSQSCGEVKRVITCKALTQFMIYNKPSEMVTII